MCLTSKILRNFCKRVKIYNIVMMRGIEDYEPSYKGLKPRCAFIKSQNVNYEPSYKG